ncbi:hypothetical protein ACJVQT_23105 [Enterobacter huaxiensis]|uniref:hypothetical protein n=1 Tax=Enterobacter huaxiensis TaxID=2494702 RepID=UPI00217606E1|nr:hypothetical protein [Enterobacter huaxiensis]MCS5452556.1 hypothetical protein [Enterobacter huaxiensis]
MSKQKAAKLLAKALNNSSKEEAAAAFSMAWSYANREGIQLSSLHTITEEAAPISEDRERELVEKYNRLLMEARSLRNSRDYWMDKHTELEKRGELLFKYVKRNFTPE